MIPNYLGLRLRSGCLTKYLFCHVLMYYFHLSSISHPSNTELYLYSMLSDVALSFHIAAQKYPTTNAIRQLDRPTRDKALSSLRTYLTSNRNFTPLELLKLWKGLFFCTSPTPSLGPPNPNRTISQLTPFPRQVCGTRTAPSHNSTSPPLSHNSSSPFPPRSSFPFYTPSGRLSPATGPPSTRYASTNSSCSCAAT